MRILAQCGLRLATRIFPLLVCLAPAPVVRGEEPLFAQADLIDESATEAIQRGLSFLLERQLDDGSFGTSGYSRNVAVCALGGMAFLAAGSTPDRGPYGSALNRTIDYLLDNMNDEGLIVADDAVSRGSMYGHGFAALFLCEAYGMAEHRLLRDRISDAIALIVRAQNREGGWRYTPQSTDADLSVTVCQVMALRAARNAGLAVPRETIDRSIAYVKACQNGDGGFRYMLAARRQPSGFARSAAGVVALYNAGVYEGEEIEDGLAYLNKFRPAEGVAPEQGYYFYGHYYAVQAMWHAGGEHWRDWYPAVRDQVVARQRADGAWNDGICPEYGAAMACIILQTPNNYLPILQR